MPTSAPPPSRRSAHWAALLGLTLALMAGACGSAPVGSPATDSQRQLKALEAEIGEARCSSDAQCHSLGVGAKPCGGPEGYRAWSSQNSDGKKLRSLADRHATTRRTENEASGLMSNCAVEADPGARCLAGRCVLRPRSGDAPSAV